MRLIDSIAYFSRYLASLIYFPTNWSLITMWFSMDAVLVMSVSIIFDYHVSLNLANILHNFCVSQWGSSIVLHTFQGISHHWFISPRIGVSLPCGSPWMQYLSCQCPLFSIHMWPYSCQHSSSLVFQIFQCTRIIDWFPYKLDSHSLVMVHSTCTSHITVLWFLFTFVPKSCQHSTELLCLIIQLITSIPYFSKYLAS